jgi:hypothetical protein
MKTEPGCILSQRRGNQPADQHTVSFRPILQIERQRQSGIILKELVRKRIPPQVVTFLQDKVEV